MLPINNYALQSTYLTMKLTFNITNFAITISLLLVDISIALYIKTGFIRHVFGDFLVVILLFYAFKTIFKWKSITIAITVLAIAYAIEFLQRFNMLTFLHLNNNKLASIILGSTFSVEDLVAYTLGIVTVLIIDYKLHHK